MLTQILEQIWKEAHAWPEYLRAMHALIQSYSPQGEAGERALSRWASFPGLCCLAAGGQAEWANELSAAWLVFYGAAYIMDGIEDGDTPGAEWAWLSPGMAVNAASGLYFSASLMLNNLQKNPRFRGIADELIGDFYRGFLAMCSGQHRDLANPRPTLEEYWEIGASKSGAFFAIASRLGARLATEDAERLQGFHDFGVQLGLLVQILDDIDDLQKAPTLEQWEDLYKTLPVIYALEHEELLDLIDASGAVPFLLTEYERQRKKADSALQRARPVPEYKEKLLAYLPAIHR